MHVIQGQPIPSCVLMCFYHLVQGFPVDFAGAVSLYEQEIDAAFNLEEGFEFSLICLLLRECGDLNGDFQECTDALQQSSHENNTVASSHLNPHIHYETDYHAYIVGVRVYSGDLDPQVHFYVLRRFDSVDEEGDRRWIVLDSFRNGTTMQPYRWDGRTRRGVVR